MNTQQLRARTRRGLLRSSAILVTAVALAGIGIAAGLAVASQKCATSQVCWDPPYANMKAGLDPKTIFEVMANSAGASRMEATMASMMASSFSCFCSRPSW